MPSTYTLNNGIELIATGEQSGTWGDTTNTNLELLDTALDGQVTVTLASAGSSGSPNTLPISDGAASNGRNRLVIFDDSSDLGATAYVQLTPNDAEKIIYVRNSLSGSRSILFFQGTYSASNDYEVPAGTTAILFFDGAGSGAVAANVFNNAHFDALNVVGQTKITTGSGNTYPTASTSADELVVSNLTASEPSGITIFSDNASSGNIFFGDENDADNGRIVYEHASGTGNPSMQLATNGAERLRIDSTGRVLVNLTATVPVASSASSDMQIANTKTTPNLALSGYGNNAGGPILTFGSSRSATKGTPGTVAVNGDEVGTLRFAADDGTDIISQAANIRVNVDGTPGSNDMPGRLTFGTTADGGVSPTERMRINSSGDVGINVTADTTTALDVMNASADTNQRALNLRYNGGMNSGANEVQLTFSNANPNSFQLARIASSYEGGTYMGSLRFYTNSNTDGANLTEAMRIDQSQRVLIGSLGAAETTLSGGSPSFQVTGSDFDSYGSFTRRQNTNYGAGVLIAKSRNTSANSYTIVQDNDTLGSLIFIGDDGTDLDTYGAMILGEVDGTPGANDMPGRLVFSTTADGASSPTERMRINNAGTVIINPNLTSGYTPLIVKGARSSATTLLSLETDDTGQDNDTINLDFKMNSGADSTERVAGRIGVQNVTTGAARGRLIFSVLEDAGNLIEAMRIDDDGEVLIGSTSATNSVTPLNLKGSAGGVSGNNFVAGKHGDSNFQPAYTTVRSRGTETSPTSVADADGIAAYNSYGYDGNSYIYTGGIQMFVDGTPGTNDMPSRIGLYTTSDGASSASERMRIDNDGNVFVGTTNGNPTGNHDPGTLIAEYGQINVHRDGGNPLRVGSSVDGNLTEYYKQGALVGSIGNASGVNIIFLAGPTSGVKVLNPSTGIDGLLPCDNTGSNRDASMDLGSSGVRYKDLYMSGGIYLGGSTSPNFLDDYETGTFSPFAGRGSAFTNEVVQNATYTKVGRLCYINIRVNWTGTDGSGNSLELELPFSCINATNGQIGTAGSMFYSGTSLKSGAAIVPHVATGQNDLTFYSSAGGSFSNLSRAEVNGSYDFVCNMVYEVQ